MTTTIAPELDAEQIGAFRERGFLALDAITTPDEIAWLRETYAELLEDRRALRLRYKTSDPGGSERRIDQIFSPELQCPRLLESEYLANARRLGAQLLGCSFEDAKPGGLMMIYKPPGAGRDAPWHQDEAYWEFPNERCHSLSVWMPLDEVNVENGCMQFIPGSQRSDLLPHKKPPGIEPIVVDAPFDASSAVPCPLSPGGATFHDCRTLHYTAPNTSPRPRRAFTTIVHGPRTPRVVPIPRTWLELA
jgi:Phytanoyl-CoA dioxygenase (PhyH)